MTQGHKTLARRALDALIDAGTWVSRVELQAGLDCSEVALDDALADLVMAGQAEFRVNVGYRLVGTDVCRRAVQLMRRDAARRSVVGAPHKDGYRVGVAEEREALGLVMYELALPRPAPGEDALQHLQHQLEGVIGFVGSTGDGNVSTVA